MATSYSCLSNLDMLKLSTFALQVPNSYSCLSNLDMLKLIPQV